jgi:UDP-N-acetylmuramoyl-tripeptide--D-alanyl-D-alanine ligase
LIGAYNADNALAAVAVGRYFKIPAERISRAINSYEPSNNRSQLKKTEKNNLIIDAYNANPSSMKAALDNFGNMRSEKKAVILGDMLELGETSDVLHEEVVRTLGGMNLDLVILCGSHFQKTGGKYKTFADKEDLKNYLTENPIAGYDILIKGSHGIGLQTLVDLL